MAGWAAVNALSKSNSADKAPQAIAGGVVISKRQAKVHRASEEGRCCLNVEQRNLAQDFWVFRNAIRVISHCAIEALKSVRFESVGHGPKPLGEFQIELTVPWG